MQTTGVITNLDIDYETRKPKISLILDTNSLDIVEQLKNENKLNIEMKKWYKKRSLDANAYCWVLCNNIANELSKNEITTKEEVYRDAILQVGSFEPFIVQEKTFEKFKSCYDEMIQTTECQTFIKGFKLGARFVMACFENDNDIYDE